MSLRDSLDGDWKTISRRQAMQAVGAATLASAAGPVLAAGPAHRPNFVIVYCDDLGYGDIGPMGGRDIPTPNLDRMAHEGMVLTDYYAPANVCSPSRAGLLTGRYPIRTGVPRVLLLPDKTGLKMDEVTFAQALKPAYTSALIGKWHLGHEAPYWPPTAHGFDHFYGIPYSHDMMPLKLYAFDGLTPAGEWPVDYHHLQQLFYTQAERFLDANHTRPFVLELALSAPHLPSFPEPDFAGKSEHAGAYGDTVMEIDSIMGRLFAKLKALGIDDNTMVVFTSDNGPWFEGSTGGLRQRKGGGGYDGGYRVPFIARWPGHIPAGTRSNAIAMGIDLFPTMCALSGTPIPAGVELDGKDISPVLTRNAPSPHDELLLFQNEDVVGVRTQRWKYVNSDFYMSYQIYLEGRGYPQLYDMREQGEQYSVASLHPDIVRALQKRLKDAAAEFEPYRTNTKPITEQKRWGPAPHIPEIWQD